MSPQRKIVLLLLALAVLAGISVTMMIKAKPRMDGINPFGDVDSATVKKIHVDILPQPYTLERGGPDWVLIEPLKDWADGTGAENLLDTLRSFSAGTVVSEKPERFKDFGLGPDYAVRIRIYGTAPDKPIFDAHVGKQAGGNYDQTYFRFESEAKVRIASNLPEYTVRRMAEDLRLRRLLPFAGADVSKIKIDGPGVAVSLTRSSNTWSMEPGGKAVDAAIVTPIKTKLEQWMISGFETQPASAPALGFGKPTLTVSIESPKGNSTAVVGNVVPVGPKAKPISRYAQTQGREAVLMIPLSTFDEILASLKLLPK